MINPFVRHSFFLVLFQIVPPQFNNLPLSYKNIKPLQVLKALKVIQSAMDITDLQHLHALRLKYKVLACNHFFALDIADNDVVI